MNSEAKGKCIVSALLLHIKGRVQGVGIRPLIYLLANQLHLKGLVYNSPEGVFVHIEGQEKSQLLFISELINNKPHASVIKEIIKIEAEVRNYSDFKILSSEKHGGLITEICPDIGICKSCIDELKFLPRRTQYPFINCTNCGPRFTIVNDFPYDRINTTMSEFEMCDDCQHEFQNPNDRRFHAQPVSCQNCGPKYRYVKLAMEINDFSEILKRITCEINEGKVAAIKGLGGYNLACDATNSNAVNEIRNIKSRDRKPFAVMFRSVGTIKKIAFVDAIEEKTITSWQYPVVILRLKENTHLANEVTSGLNSIGAFLPYLPLHYLLFEQLKTEAIVLTSGNESDTPILYKDDEALQKLNFISGGIITNNREIARRNDDSVVRIIQNEPRLIRRSRGYVPSPVDLNFEADGILATGAELSNCFSIGKGRQAILSQHIGDLKNADTYDFFSENIEEFSRIYRFSPTLVACDLHPDYLSTRYAHETNLPVYSIQHHHAHIAAVMAEYQLTQDVIGISYDGTGFGTDGTIWGSEVMVANMEGFDRISYFQSIPLPGGDTATKQTWRSALAYIYSAFSVDWKNIKIPFLSNIDLLKAAKLVDAMDKGINCPLCCSAGRIFDAVAALTEICTESNYHAEAPQLMENYLDKKCIESYTFSGNEEISFLPTIREIVSELRIKTPLNKIITKFHNTIAMAAIHQVELALRISAIKKVVISGGTFQNKYLTEKLVLLLNQKDVDVYIPRNIPCNDGGIALGQLAVAAAKSKK